MPLISASAPRESCSETRPGLRPAASVLSAWRTFFVVVFASASTSCSTLSFYHQAAAGQLSIVSQQAPTDEVIASPATDARLRERLLKATELVQFAQDHLSLEPEERFSSYVRIDGDYVVWNVFATPEFSTQPTQWCYPIAGCASYRGYFKQRDARKFAQQLIARRQDTTVGGVAAYSTLGWFDDPLLSTFIDWPEAELAGLIFHELAHARVFVPGDTAFNEAFASFVERRGVLQWLRAQHDEVRIERVTARWKASDRFIAFLLQWRDELQLLYGQPYNTFGRRLLKSELLAEIERCYRANPDQFGDQDWFFRDGLNNARLVPLAAYNELVSGFAGLFIQADGSWPLFYSKVMALGASAAEARTAELTRLGREQQAFERDADSVPVMCAALRF